MDPLVKQPPLDRGLPWKGGTFLYFKPVNYPGSTGHGSGFYGVLTVFVLPIVGSKSAQLRLEIFIPEHMVEI